MRRSDLTPPMGGVWIFSVTKGERVLGSDWISCQKKIVTR